MGLFKSAGWCAVYTVLCVYAHPTKDASEVHDLQMTAGGYALKDRFTDGLRGFRKSDLESLPSVLIPLKSVTAPRNGFAIMTRPVEPDAEMLPAHYRGVKPPGVDHMELRRFDALTLESQPKITYVTQAHSRHANAAGGGQVSNSGASMDAARITGGGSKAHGFEHGSKGSSGTEKEKSQHSEDAGTKKQHSDEAAESGDHEDHAESADGGKYAHTADRKGERNSMGYHRVYHKDEQKKSADYYKNGNRGGKYKKHGHYNEKHVAHEADYKKGASKKSAASQDAAGKEGVFEKAHVAKEAEGHQAQDAYDHYAKNFKGFGQQVASAKGGKTGFAHAKGH